MELIVDNNVYSSFYSASNDYFDLNYEEFIKNFHESFLIRTKSIQTLYDTLMGHMMYWVEDFEEINDDKLIDKIRFEIDGLDFYKFLYDYEWYPYKLIDIYDGKLIENNTIRNITLSPNINEITISLENEKLLIIKEMEYMNVFNISEKSEISDVIFRLLNTCKLYFDGRQYFFINRNNIHKVEHYLLEQICFLNKIYSDLKLPLIEFIK